MSNRKDGGNAFPLSKHYCQLYPGMSLRDYFASTVKDPPDWWILHVCNVTCFPIGGREYCEAVASWKYMQSDAMLERRTIPRAIEVQRVNAR